MDDKKILQIIQQLAELVNANEFVIEDNFIYIPSIELIRNKEGNWEANI